MKELVILDLDGTIIDGQSQQLFLNYVFEKRMISLFFYSKIYFWFILYKLGLAKNPRKIMERAFSFLRNKEVEVVEKIAGEFFDERLKGFIFPEIIDIIRQHKEKDRELIVVSNSVDLIVRPVANFLGIENYIATKPEVLNGNFTGRILGDIIYGRNKVNFVREFASKSNFSLIGSYGYSDHVSDLDLLMIVSNSYVVNPNKSLMKEARKRNWPILLFKKIK
jgi:HAD superfamily hydrolase (TIGR01490 family)